MTPAERGRRLGRIAAYVVPVACALFGLGVGLGWRAPDAISGALAFLGIAGLLAFLAFARRELRIAEREEAAARVPKTPEQVGAEIYALTRSPLVLRIELNQKGRDALMKLAASKGLSIERAWLYAAQVVADGGGKVEPPC